MSLRFIEESNDTLIRTAYHICIATRDLPGLILTAFKEPVNSYLNC